MWSRLHIAPLLQAEEDRDQVRRYYADKEREKELLGSEMKVYNSDRYVLSTLGVNHRSPIRSASLIVSIAQLRPPYLCLYPFQGHQINKVTVSLIQAMLPFASARGSG